MCVGGVYITSYTMVMVIHCTIPTVLNNVTIFIYFCFSSIPQQMRSAWPLSTIPPQHTAQHINQHGLLAHVVSPSVGMAQSQTNTNSPAQQIDDRRRAEHDRMMAVEREQQEQQRYYVSQGVSVIFLLLLIFFFCFFVTWLFWYVCGKLLFVMR